MVGVVHEAAGGEGGEEAVLARGEGGVRAGSAAFGAGVREVVRHDVGEGADVGVFQLGEVLRDVIVEIDFHDRVLRFVGVAARAAVIPVPTRGADDGLVVWEFSAVDDGGAGGFEEGDQGEELRVLGGVVEGPERLPGEAEDGAFEGGGIGEELGVAACWGFADLSGGIVVAGVGPVDGVEDVDGIADGAGEGADGVLVGAFWNDAGESQIPDGCEGGNVVLLAQLSKSIRRWA